jgi:hypothetical protein
LSYGSLPASAVRYKYASAAADANTVMLLACNVEAQVTA